MELRRYPLLDIFLNGCQADAAAKVHRRVGSVLATLLEQIPVTTDQSDNDASRRIEDRNNDCLETSPEATQCQTVLNFNLGSLGKTRLKSLTDGL